MPIKLHVGVIDVITESSRKNFSYLSLNPRLDFLTACKTGGFQDFFTALALLEQLLGRSNAANFKTAPPNKETDHSLAQNKSLAEMGTTETSCEYNKDVSCHYAVDGRYFS